MSRVLIIAGPTASGKSSLALEKARKENGVIINADSMQVYNALHILAAHPSKEEQKEVPHVLYGFLEPHEKCTVTHWQQQALQEIDKAHQAGQTPILTGGTGFYIQGLVEGFSPIPDIPDDIRHFATKKQAALGNPAFHKVLAEKDPDMAARLNPNDTQRLIRAWEVLEATGKSLLYWQSLPKEKPAPHLRFEMTLCLPDREKLYERCNQRFDWMLDHGALEEVEALDALIRAKTVPAEASITHALGFKELRAYLNGEMSKADAIDKGKQETRRYAKRQMTWFRNQKAPL